MTEQDKLFNMKFSNDHENWIECEQLTLKALFKGLTFLYYHSDAEKIEIMITKHLDSDCK